MEDTGLKAKGTIAICTPMYGDMAHRTYINTIILLHDALREEVYTATLKAMGNESLITRARNLLVHQALQIEDLAGVLFIDSDIGADPDEIVMMIKSGKKVIGGVYPKKSINWNSVRNAVLLDRDHLELYSGNFAVNLLDAKEPTTISLNEPVEVKHIGTGLMYISADVFEKLKPFCKVFDNNYIGEKAIEGSVVEYFFTKILDDDTRELLSEDYSFCELWRSLGESVWAAPWAKVSHTGTYTFSGNLLHTLELISTVGKMTNPKQ